MYSGGSSSFTRSPSNGSIDRPILSPGESSNQNTDCSITTDDEDSDSHKSASTYKERRREAHTAAEQKRRDAIKQGYVKLQDLVPSCQHQDSVSSYKLSKATILQRSIDYIEKLQGDQDESSKELTKLQNEAMALEIMKDTSEQMVKQYHDQSQSGRNSAQVISDEDKIKVFLTICDQLFQSFDGQVTTDNFQSLSSSIFSWLEENCKPETLRHITASVMGELNTNHQSS